MCKMEASAGDGVMAMVVKVGSAFVAAQGRLMAGEAAAWARCRCERVAPDCPVTSPAAGIRSFHRRESVLDHAIVGTGR
jgi:hypothetical protein